MGFGVSTKDMNSAPYCAALDGKAGTGSTRRTLSATLGNLPVVKLAFPDDKLVSFVGRASNAVTDGAAGPWELPDNPVLATRPSACFDGGAQPRAALLAASSPAPR